MNNVDYRDEVKRTAQGNCNSFLFGAMGLAGESGEVIEIIKKMTYQGEVMDRDRLIEELGDVRWYLEYLCIAVDATMEEVEKRNVEKLQKRYPDGFSLIREGK